MMWEFYFVINEIIKDNENSLTEIKKIYIGLTLRSSTYVKDSYRPRVCTVLPGTRGHEHVLRGTCLRPRFLSSFQGLPDLCPEWILTASVQFLCPTFVESFEVHDSLYLYLL